MNNATRQLFFLEHVPDQKRGRSGHDFLRYFISLYCFRQTAARAGLYCHLDDFSGLGPVRRAALLEHFGSIDRLRAASAAEIQDVPGLGPKLARELHQFLLKSHNQPKGEQEKL
jgi:hypothetical protein